MSELKPCPLCNADKPYRTATPVIGIPSGDSGYSMTIKCRECGCEIKRWAEKTRGLRAEQAAQAVEENRSESQ